MNGVDPYIVVIGISSLVVFSYVFDWLSKKTNFPSVLLLLGVGMIAKWFVNSGNIEVPDVNPLLTITGIIGLILIVLEGSLDLTISRKKLNLVYNSLLSAFIILLVTAFSVAFIIQGVTGQPFLISLINAVPFSVVSSAITIPSVANLSKQKREFLTYESTFSDILGIMFFNFIVINEVINFQAITLFFGEIVLLITISVVSTIALMYFMTTVRSHHKFFLIFAILMIIYSFGKRAHLSTLLLIMFFGLVLNNNHLLQNIKLGKWLRFFDFPTLDRELQFMKSVTAEVTFLVRTIFFVLFGYTFDLSLLSDQAIWVSGLAIVGSMLLIRFLYLRFTIKKNVLPDIFIAPRGLITILLFFSIPADKVITDLGQGLLFFVIITSNLVMMSGLMIWRDKKGNSLTVSEIEEARSGNVDDNTIDLFKEKDKQ